ncbi:hypothetical protein C8A00DRAFT_13387, partial [Chaetomidium leptoderma]
SARPAPSTMAEPAAVTPGTTTTTFKSPTRTPTNLPTLPIDLLLLIITPPNLDYPTLLALSSTSRALHLAINPDTLTPRAEKVAFYQHAERHFPQHADRLVCFVCWRFVDSQSFGDSKRRGRFGRFGDKSSSRFCWECGVKGGLYDHLRGVRKGGLVYYPCRRCGRAGVGSERCLREVCTPPLEEGGGGSPLERLVAVGAVGGVLFGLLGYRELVRLRMVSRTMRRVVYPVGQCRDVYGMWKFVMERLKGSSRHLGRWGSRSGPRACFGCFRPRTKAHFSPAQYQLSSGVGNGEYWRRRCWECLRRFYHPRLADTEARARFDRQVLCGVCRCLRYRDEDCHGCEVRQDEIAEWARRRSEKQAAKHDYWEESDPALQLLDEDAPAASTGEQPESDDLWGEGTGSWLDSPTRDEALFVTVEQGVGVGGVAVSAH